jgi:hypothetical protein
MPIIEEMTFLLLLSTISPEIEKIEKKNLKRI